MPAGVLIRARKRHSPFQTMAADLRLVPEPELLSRTCHSDRYFTNPGAFLSPLVSLPLSPSHFPFLRVYARKRT